MGQSEVLSRITMFLMLVSASVVSLALIGQVTQFDQRFIAFALVLLALVLLVGTMTQMRVRNAAIEDLAHVIGMNRLRAGYVDLDPDIERYLVTSAHDDDKGLWQTYNHLACPKTSAFMASVRGSACVPSPIAHTMQPLSSGAAFITYVNAALTAVFAALVAVAFDGSVPLVAAAAAACGLAFLGTSLIVGSRQYDRVGWQPAE